LLAHGTGKLCSWNLFDPYVDATQRYIYLLIVTINGHKLSD
jgi:hypothetical protein